MNVFPVLLVSVKSYNICQRLVSVQYRKILHTCITLIYMAIYFNHKIRQFIEHWPRLSSSEYR